MPAGGRLFIGASESLLRLGTDFDLQEVGKAFNYILKAKDAGKAMGGHS
jgi:hypothetical protein